MGLFKKKKQVQPDAISIAVNNSTLRMLTHQLFMHYFDATMPVEPNNPEWQNQGIFFWNADERFERKSLPPNFKDLEEKYFIVNEVPVDVSVSKGTAIPWFGMPGGGDKYFFVKNDAHFPIKELIPSSAISYVELIKLNPSNLHVLNDRVNYSLLLDTEKVRYEPHSDKFFLNGSETNLGGCYQGGGVKVIRLT